VDDTTAADPNSTSKASEVKEDIGDSETMAAHSDDAIAQSDTLAHGSAQAIGESDTVAHGSAEVVGDSATLISGGGAATAGSVVLPRVDPDRYVAGREFAKGGLGRITEVHDVVLKRPVLLKQLLRENPAAERRFVREALITARLAHPGIVPIYEAGRLANGEAFYSMKRIDGHTLGDELGKAESLADRLALLHTLITVAETMAYAHSQGVIHRDIKPNNVIVGGFGETVVIDWGLAKDLRSAEDTSAETSEHTSQNDSPELTAAGSVMGTPLYMSPRQAKGLDIDERADVYAIGVMLYQLLSGQRPYREAKSASEVLAKIQLGPPEPIVAHEPAAPRELVAIAEKAMAWDLDKRYRSAAELAEELRDFQTGKLVGAHEYSAGQLLGRWLRRHKAAVAVASVAVVVMVIAGTISVSRIVSERDRANSERDRANVSGAAEKKANAASTRRLATLYVEQGRQALLADQDSKAVKYLEDAKKLGERSPVLGMLLNQARASGDRQTKATTLPGHKTHTVVVAFAPAGEVVVTGGDDGARAWNYRTGKQLAHLDLGSIARIQFSPSGKRIALFTDDGKLHVRSPSAWAHPGVSVDAGKDVRPIIAFSPDDKLVAAAAHAKGVSVWQTTGGKLLRHIPIVAGSVAFSLDNVHMFVGGYGNNSNVVQFEVASGKKLRTLELKAKAVVGLATVRNDQILAQSDKGVHHWNYATGEVVAWVKPPTRRLVNGIHALPHKQFALFWYTSGKAELYSIKDRRVLREFSGHTHYLVRGGLSADEKYVFTAGSDGRVLVWPLAISTPSVIIGERRGATFGVAFAPQSSHIAVTFGRQEVRVLDYKHRPRFHPGDHAVFDANDMAISGDGKWAVVSGLAPRMSIVNVATGEATTDLAKKLEAPIWLRAAERGTRFCAIGSRGRLVTFDAATGKRLAAWKTADTAATLSADGKWVAGMNADKVVGVWSAATGKLKTSIAVGMKAWHLNFSPDGTKIVASGLDGSAALLDVAAGSLVKLKSHGERTLGGKFSPDGSLVMTIGLDGVMRASDASTGGERYVVKDASALTMSSQGTLVVGRRSGRIGVHDPATGKLLREWKAHSTQVLMVRFAPDGRRLASSAISNDSHVWDTLTGSELMRVPRLGGSAFTRVEWAADGTILTTTWRNGLYPVFWHVDPR